MKLLSPARRRIAVQHAREQGLSERRACRLVSQPRGTQRYQPTQRHDSVGQNVAFNMIGLGYGIFIVWLYAMIRPRYGAGPKTAVWAGLAVWVAGVLLPNAAFMGAAGLFPVGLTAMTTAGGIVEFVAAALAGSALYKEGAESVRAMPARA